MADAMRSSQILVNQSSLKNNSHQDGSSSKMLINEMCNQENTKLDRAGVVARLMGMDTMPHKTRPTAHAKDFFDINLGQHTPNMLHCERTKVDLCSLTSTAKKLPSKPHRRDHPQEEQLHKFKKEFEAWQESKLWEFSSNHGHYSSEDLNSEQILALESLNKEKMAVYADTCLTQKKHVDTDDYVLVNKLKITQNQLHSFRNDGHFRGQLVPKIEDDMAIRRELEANGTEPASSAKFQEKRSTPCSPKRIVILIPSSDEMEVPCRGSPVVVEKGSSMEDFLEKVKERLKLEMEGKGRNDSISRLSVGHTSHESWINPKQLAREAAKHGAMLRRSQSMIAYRNSFHFDGQGYSNSIKRETKKFISDRLKNVLNDDTGMKKPLFDDGSAGKSVSVKDASFWDDKKAKNESIPKHLRAEYFKLAPFGDEAMSPSNLETPFSASASGSAFGKALLEDQRAATEAQNYSAVIKKGKKDGFSIKNTVLNLRRNLGLRANFFGKKASSMRESPVDTVLYAKQDETAPSAIRNIGFVQENSTEVPPSPASFPCSPINERHSPVSPLEVPFIDDHSSTQVSGELSMTVTEIGSQTEHAESKLRGMATQIQLYDSNETILIEGCGEAYVRDMLVVSGLYRPCWPLDQAISRLDGQIKPISSSVFDEVEEKCKNLRNVDDDCSTVSLRDIDIDRKMLFDLLNEALLDVLDPPMSRSMSTHGLARFPHGRELLDELLNQIQTYANPKVDEPQSIEKMVVCDLKLKPWLASSHEDISSLCREVEWVIIRELIDDLLSDLLA